MSTSSVRSRLGVAAALAVLASTAGCGGSSGSMPVTVQIDWAARSRGVGGPSSALSASIVVFGAKPDGGDIRFSAERPAGAAAVSGSYRSPGNAEVGSFPVAVHFYAWPGPSGSEVGIAYTTLTVNPDGTTNVARVTNTEGTILSVSIPEGQAIKVGEQKPLAAITDQALALEPGSYFWKVLQGGDHLQLQNGVPLGVSAGSAVVSVTVDGITSEPQTVTVVPP